MADWFHTNLWGLKLQINKNDALYNFNKDVWSLDKLNEFISTFVKKKTRTLDHFVRLLYFFYWNLKGFRFFFGSPLIFHHNDRYVWFWCNEYWEKHDRRYKDRGNWRKTLSTNFTNYIEIIKNEWKVYKIQLKETGPGK